VPSIQARSGLALVAKRVLIALFHGRTHRLGVGHSFSGGGPSLLAERGSGPPSDSSGRAGSRLESAFILEMFWIGKICHFPKGRLPAVIDFCQATAIFSAEVSGQATRPVSCHSFCTPGLCRPLRPGRPPSRLTPAYRAAPAGPSALAASNRMLHTGVRET